MVILYGDFQSFYFLIVQKFVVLCYFLVVLALASFRMATHRWKRLRCVPASTDLSPVFVSRVFVAAAL